MSFGKRLAALVVNQGLQALAQIAMIVVAARGLSLSDYGIYRQFFLRYELSAALLGFGLSQAAYYFLAKSSDTRRLFIQFCFLLALTTTLGFLIIFLPISGATAEAQDHFGNWSGLWLLPLTYASLLTPICLAFSLVAGKLQAFAWANSLLLAVNVLAFSVACLATGELELAVWTRVVLGSASIVVLGLMAAQFSRLDSKTSEEVAIKKIFLYSLPIGAASAVGVLSQYLDKLIVSTSASPSDYAVYANGAIEIPLLGVITSAISTAGLYEFSRHCEAKQYAQALALFRSIASKSSMALFPVAVFLLLTAEDFLVAIFGPAYHASATPFRLFLLLLPARTMLYGPVLVALGRSNAILRRSIVELLLVAVIAVVSARLIGFNYAALGLIVATYVWSVPFNLRQIATAMNVPMQDLLPGTHFVKVALTCVGAAVPASYASHLMSTRPLSNLCVAAIVFVGLLLALYRWAGLLDLSQVMKNRFART